jgi:hypothetical protein
MSEKDDDSSVERRGAQALLATFMQMTRHAELARELQIARQRATERRLRAAARADEIAQLQRQLTVQQGQKAAIDGAVNRFHSRVPELANLAEAGLTFDDYEQLGLEKIVKKDDVDEARRRGAEARRGAHSTPPETK